MAPLPVPYRNPHPELEDQMNRTRRRRLALVLAAVCAIGALSAAVAFGAARRGDDVAVRDSGGTFRLTVPSLTDTSTFSWSAGGNGGEDIITVAGGRCPKSHPRRLGSSSSSSWTQIDGGPVRHRSRRRSICAR
jgi:hypothetical protein